MTHSFPTRRSSELAHIGIDRKPAVAEGELVAFERSGGQVAQREIAHRRESLRTIQQMPGPRHMISPPLFLRRTALWSEKPLPLSSWLVKRPPVAGPSLRWESAAIALQRSGVRLPSAPPRPFTLPFRTVPTGASTRRPRP